MILSIGQPRIGSPRKTERNDKDPRNCPPWDYSIYRNEEHGIPSSLEVNAFTNLYFISSSVVG